MSDRIFFIGHQMLGLKTGQARQRLRHIAAVTMIDIVLETQQRNATVQGSGKFLQ